MIACIAARPLTPTTLHLAGKSSILLDSPSMSTRSLVRAARKILWAKSVDAGQAIGVPDWRKKESCRLSRTQAVDRVAFLVSRTKGQIVIGGETVREKRYVASTVVRGVPSSDVLSQNGENLMAPIRPIVPVERWDDRVELLETLETLGTTYVFSRDQGFRGHVLQTTKSAKTIINQTTIHGSDSQATGGQDGFDAFSQHRAVLGGRPGRSSWDSGILCRVISTPLRYPYPTYSDANGARENGDGWFT
ncbi:hypothetical protein PM082_014038 [Marasmius tenuissimus]|nr:hypothetical protein PM082_014038 [Marasmius tenuissimus]